jgi:hypothetical protein
MDVLIHRLCYVSVKTRHINSGAWVSDKSILAAYINDIYVTDKRFITYIETETLGRDKTINNEPKKQKDYGIN